MASRSCADLRMIFTPTRSVVSLARYKPTIQQRASLRYGRAWFSKSERSKPAAQPALLEKAIVMTHEQVRFHLSHRIQQHTHHNQHTRAAKELRDGIRNFHAQS